MLTFKKEKEEPVENLLKIPTYYIIKIDVKKNEIKNEIKSEIKSEKDALNEKLVLKISELEKLSELATKTKTTNEFKSNKGNIEKEIKNLEKQIKEFDKESKKSEKKIISTEIDTEFSKLEETLLKNNLNSGTRMLFFKNKDILEQSKDRSPTFYRYSRFYVITDDQSLKLNKEYWFVYQWIPANNIAILNDLTPTSFINSSINAKLNMTDKENKRFDLLSTLCFKLSDLSFDKEEKIGLSQMKEYYKNGILSERSFEVTMLSQLQYIISSNKVSEIDKEIKTIFELYVDVLDNFVKEIRFAFTELLGLLLKKKDYPYIVAPISIELLLLPQIRLKGFISVDYNPSRTISNLQRFKHETVRAIATYFYGSFPVIYGIMENGETKIKERFYWNKITTVYDNQFNGKYDLECQKMIKLVPIDHLPNWGDAGVLYFGVTTNSLGVDYWYVGETTDTWEFRHMNSYNKFATHSSGSAIGLLGFTQYVSSKKVNGVWTQEKTSIQKSDAAYAKNGFGKTRFYLLWKSSTREKGPLNTCEAYFMEYFKKMDDKRIPPKEEFDAVMGKGPISITKEKKIKLLQSYSLNIRPEKAKDEKELKLLIKTFGDVGLNVYDSSEEETSKNLLKQQKNDVAMEKKASLKFIKESNDLDTKSKKDAIKLNKENDKLKIKEEKEMKKIEKNEEKSKIKLEKSYEKKSSKLKDLEKLQSNKATLIEDGETNQPRNKRRQIKTDNEEVVSRRINMDD